MNDCGREGETAFDPSDHQVSTPFTIKAGASILDYLNPEIWGNDTIIDSMRYSLQNHQLVAIHDAFVPEFADHVWSDLVREDMKWEHHQDFDVQGFSCR